MNLSNLVQIGPFTIVIAFLLGPSLTIAQSTANAVLWEPIAQDELERKEALRGQLPKQVSSEPQLNAYSEIEGKQFTLNSSLLMNILASPPEIQTKEKGDLRVSHKEASRALASSDSLTRIPIPLPNGDNVTFLIQPSNSISNEFERDHQAIRSYRGIADDPTDPRTLRLDISPSGLYAEITSLDGNTIIAPTNLTGSIGKGRSRYIAFTKDFAAPISKNMVCETASKTGYLSNPSKRNVDGKIQWGNEIRTYRLAVAATPEYIAQTGGTIDLALQAIVRTVNRVNAIYERDLAIRLELVSGNAKLLSRSNRRGLNNDDAGILINQSQALIDRVIGSDNYDVGHTFSTGAGGLASLASVAVKGQKARGVTGSLDPLRDPYDVDYVAHEIGHQFGANHTFNGEQNSCSSRNWNASTAFEPGSGSTIMAYAGICGTDNLQKHSDDYFHVSSIKEIAAHVGTAGESENKMASANQIPDVVTGEDMHMPIGTPFMLSASASDPNPFDTLTYVWEQLDAGVQAPRTAPDDGLMPLVKSERPSLRNLRNIYAHNDTNGDPLVRLPSRSRTSTFAITVRDAHFGAGGIASDSITVNFYDFAGPFSVVKPDSTIDSNKSFLIKWDVSNTNKPPINATKVNIRASVDGGVTFPFSLLDNTPNDGSEEATLPGTPDQLMIRVEGIKNKFYALSQNLKVD